MENCYLDNRAIAPNQEKVAPAIEKKVVLDSNLIKPADFGLKEREITEKASKKSNPLREGLGNLKKEVKNMGTVEFSFWIVNTLLLFMIVLKEFLLI